MRRRSVMLVGGMCVVAAAFLALRVAADTPLPPPTVQTIWSPNRGHCAVMDPRRQVTTVFRVASAGDRTPLWAMVGWFRGAALADDGEHLVLCHPGLNLLPLDVQDDDVLLWFVRRGELIRAVPLADVVPRAALRRTASHWHWGGAHGFDAEGRYVVEPVSGPRIRFDVATGRPVADAPLR